MKTIYSVIAVVVLSLGFTKVHAQLADPIPAPVSPGALTVKIVDWIQVPDSSGNAARINMAYHSRDDSGRLFVNDQRGFLYVIENDVISLYLHLHSVLTNALTENHFGAGFHGFTFHPEFAVNGIFYTVHTEANNTGTPDLSLTEGANALRHSIVTEWTATNPAAAIFAGTHREMLRIAEPGTLHTIQEIGFNPNAKPGDSDYAMLFVAQGDGGVMNSNRPQSLDSAHGSLLRIDPAGNNSASGRYGIPADNPFANDGEPQTLPEIWAYGFRNPHRFSWDTGGTEKMLIVDIGEANIEELNIGDVGANYGWNQREGNFLFDKNTPQVVYPLPVEEGVSSFTYPVAQYDHDEGSAITGGFVYRGTAIPELTGQYLFGDIVNGRIFYVHVDDLINGQQAIVRELNLVDVNDQPTNVQGQVANPRSDLRFGITQDQEIVILTKTDGMIRKLESTNPGDTDLDGVVDMIDNCQLVENADQRDTDLDGYGNICDPDLNNDNVVNFFDLSLFIEVFLTSNANADFNGDGAVNFFDFLIIRDLFLGAPGPGIN